MPPSKEQLLQLKNWSSIIAESARSKNWNTITEKEETSAFIPSKEQLNQLKNWSFVIAEAARNKSWMKRKDLRSKNHLRKSGENNVHKTWVPKQKEQSEESFKIPIITKEFPEESQKVEQETKEFPTKTKEIKQKTVKKLRPKKMRPKAQVFQEVPAVIPVQVEHTVPIQVPVQVQQTVPAQTIGVQQPIPAQVQQTVPIQSVPVPAIPTQQVVLENPAQQPLFTPVQVPSVPVPAIPTQQVVLERPVGAIPTGIEMAHGELQPPTVFVSPPPLMKDPLQERKSMVDKMSKEIFDRIAAKVLNSERR